MARRHPALPALWLMTDERQSDALWPALCALPRGSGIVFRHHALAAPERAALLARVARLARRRGLTLWTEQSASVLILRPFDPHANGGAAWIARVHDHREGIAARRAGAIAMFVSPVFATRTHPGRPALGPLRAAAIVRDARLPAIALGGMTSQRFARMKALGFHGWAAIDDLMPRQKRNAVPI